MKGVYGTYITSSQRRSRSATTKGALTVWRRIPFTEFAQDLELQGGGAGAEVAHILKKSVP